MEATCFIFVNVLRVAGGCSQLDSPSSGVDLCSPSSSSSLTSTSASHSNQHLHPGNNVVFLRPTSLSGTVNLNYRVTSLPPCSVGSSGSGSGSPASSSGASSGSSTCSPFGDYGLVGGGSSSGSSFLPVGSVSNGGIGYGGGRPSALGLFSSSSFGRVGETHWVSFSSNI